MTELTQMAEQIFDMFDSLLPVSEIPNCPKGNSSWLFNWEEDTKRDDWKADGYRWRQNGGQKSVKVNSGTMTRTYYHVSFCLTIC